MAFVNYAVISAKDNPFHVLSVRARKTLVRLGIGTIDDLCKLTSERIRETRNCGITTSLELEDFLRMNGRWFGDGVVSVVTPETFIPKELSLRDWFAGQAMNGIIAANDTNWPHPRLAMEAYELADAMLAERAKAQP